MSDRAHSIQVVLQEDMRVDDLEQTMAAIRQLVGVINVSPIIADVESLMAESRVRNEVQMRLLQVIKELDS